MPAEDADQTFVERRLEEHKTRGNVSARELAQHGWLAMPVAALALSRTRTRSGREGERVI